MAVGLLVALGLQAAWGATIDPITPEPGSASLASPPEMRVWVRGITTTNTTLRFYRRATPPAIRPDFTLVVLPDTQFYTGHFEGQPPHNPEIFYSQTDWIVANRENWNIVFTTHVGDIVLLAGLLDSEWEIANDAISRLENPVTTHLDHGIPYSLAAAAHDGFGEFVNYNRYFGVSRFADRPYYGGCFGNNNINHYSYFSASGMDFIVVSLQEDASVYPGVLDWANQVLSAHSDRRAIVVSHNLLIPGGQWSSQGLAIYDALKENSNIFLMLCGHVPQTGWRTDTYNGHSITTVLQDYTNEADVGNSGNGWLRLMKFVPASNQIQVKTYSPWLDQYKGSYHEFTFPYSMAIPDPPFTLMNSVNVTADGIVSGGFWSDLKPSTSYDWYVTLDETGVETVFPTWTFTTAPTYSSITYPPLEPGPSDLKVVRVSKPVGEYPAILWRSVGGHRYRVEYSNGGADFVFHEIVRSPEDETDPAPEGTSSFQVFVDDGSWTGGSADSRFYRIREVP